MHKYADHLHIKKEKDMAFSENLLLYCIALHCIVLYCIIFIEKNL